MFCIHCGSQNHEGALFCANCGQPLASQPQAPQQPQNQQPQYQQPVPQYQQPQYQQPAPQYQQPQYQQAVPQYPQYSQAPVNPVSYGAPVVGTAARAGTSATAVVAANTATGVAKATMSTGKRIAILGLVLAFLVGAFSAYLSVFVSGPVDTVERFFEASNNLDYQGMVDCLDPTTGRMMDATLGLVGDLIGFDISALLDLAPALSGFMDTDMLGLMDVQSAEVLLYSDDSAKALYNRIAQMEPEDIEPGTYWSDNEVVEFLYQYNIKLPGIEKLTAKSAVVKISLISDGAVSDGYLLLENQGGGDWRIYLDFSMLYGS